MKSRELLRRNRRIGGVFLLLGVAIVTCHVAWRGYTLPLITLAALARKDYGTVTIYPNCASLGIHGHKLEVKFRNDHLTILKGMWDMPLLARRTRSVQAEFLSEEDGRTLGGSDPIGGLLTNEDVLVRELHTESQQRRNSFPPMPGDPGVPSGDYLRLFRLHRGGTGDIDECTAMVRNGTPSVTATEVYWDRIGFTTRGMLGTNFALAAGALLSLFGSGLWLLSKASKEGHCAACGYDLRATPLGKPCPECGHAVVPASEVS